MPRPGVSQLQGFSNSDAGRRGTVIRGSIIAARKQHKRFAATCMVAAMVANQGRLRRLGVGCYWLVATLSCACQ